jgi:hypothetical protein
MKTRKEQKRALLLAFIEHTEPRKIKQKKQGILATLLSLFI